MINATDMAKVFNEKPIHFLRNSQTKKFISALKQKLGVVQNRTTPQNCEIVKIVKDPNGTQGTWMHEKLALKFASWLDPEFELWVYDY